QNIVEKRGAFYLYGEMRIGQGRENVKQFLRENPQLLEEIEGRIRQALDIFNIGSVISAAESRSSDDEYPEEVPEADL
ncbi:MAG: recombinase RecA, partial [Anaerolineae bacterium]